MNRRNHSEIGESARETLLKCVALQSSDALMIVCSKSSRPLAEIFVAAARDVCAETFLIIRENPPFLNGVFGEALRALLPHVQAALLVHPALSPTVLPAKESVFQMQKIMCIPANDPETFLKWSNLKVNRIAEKTMKISEILSIGRKLDITTKNNGNLSMSIRRKNGLPDTGKILEKMQMCSLPAGEVRIQPVVSSIQGKIYVDKIAGVAHEGEGTMLTIKGGKITRIQGQNKFAGMLRRRFRCAEKTIKEISLGINEYFDFGENYYEDKRTLGAVSLTFNFREANSDASGLPLSTILAEPTLKIDGRGIMNNGQTALV